MIKGFSGVCSAGSRFEIELVIRGLVTSSTAASSTKAQARKLSNEIFNDEKRKQQVSVGRINKIRVKYCSWEENITLLMNKELSTPYDCARHISEGMATMSALASVDGVSWDMNRPLVSDCELKLSTMRTPFDKSVNNAFWRTCSLMLGSIIDSAFKDNIELHLHSFTSPHIKSGSFIYDVQLGLKDWEATNAEKRSLSSLFFKLAHQNVPVERLETNPSVALQIFKNNPHKTKQIPDIASNNDNKIVLYRIGEHIDISKGPMVGNTGLVGRSTIAAVHKIQSEDGEQLYRFQGVAIPKGIHLNHFTYGILEDRARKLNETAWMPHRLSEDSEVNLAIAAKN